MTAAVIEARGLCFAYTDHAVLRGVGLRVDAGEIFGLVGADGAGKSTLLRILIGQLRPQQGELRVLGEPAESPALRAQTAYMPQGFGLYSDLSVRENLHFFADLHGLDAATAARRSQDLLRRTGLEGFEARRAGALSGGMMQKLALACALLSEPRVMFLDEPTTGVDPLARRAFWNLLEGVRAEGVGIVYATANLEEAERCDRVGLLENGGLRRQGSPLELAAIPGDAVLVRVSGGSARAQRAAVAALPGVERVFAMGQRLHVWLRGGAGIEAFRDVLAAAAPDLSVESAAATLHDVTLRQLALAHAAAGAHAH